MPRSMRVTAVEIRVEIDGGTAAHLRLEGPEIERFERLAAGRGRLRVELVAEGREVVIGPRYGGQGR